MAPQDSTGHLRRSLMQLRELLAQARSRAWSRVSSGEFGRQALEGWLLIDNDVEQRLATIDHALGELAGGADEQRLKTVLAPIARRELLAPAAPRGAIRH